MNLCIFRKSEHFTKDVYNFCPSFSPCNPTIFTCKRRKLGMKTHQEFGGLVAKLCPTLVTSWTVAHQAPPSMGFSKQEYWSGLPFPSPGDFPHPGIKHASLMSPALAGGFFTTSATWEAQYSCAHQLPSCQVQILPF